MFQFHYSKRTKDVDWQLTKECNFFVKSVLVKTWYILVSHVFITNTPWDTHMHMKTLQTWAACDNLIILVTEIRQELKLYGFAFLGWDHTLRRMCVMSLKYIKRFHFPSSLRWTLNSLILFQWPPSSWDSIVFKPLLSTSKIFSKVTVKHILSSDLCKGFAAFFWKFFLFQWIAS